MSARGARPSRWRALAAMMLLVLSSPSSSRADDTASREDDEVVWQNSSLVEPEREAGEREHGDSAVFAGVMIACSVTSTALAIAITVPTLNSYGNVVFGPFIGGSLAHLDLLLCPSIAMSIAGRSTRGLYAELVGGSAVGLVGGSALGFVAAWISDQTGRGTPTATGFGLMAAYLLGSIGTTVAAIVTYEFRLGRAVPIQVAAAPLDGGLLLSASGAW